MRKNRRRAVVYVSTGLACLPRDTGMPHLRDTPPWAKTAEERFHMLARGWLAYPVTPTHHPTPAEERWYMSSPDLQII